MSLVTQMLVFYGMMVPVLIAGAIITLVTIAAVSKLKKQDKVDI